MWPTDDAAAGAGRCSTRPMRATTRAIEVRERFVDDVAAAVRLLVLTTDVDDVVIGGGLAALGDPLLGGCAPY